MLCHHWNINFLHYLHQFVCWLESLHLVAKTVYLFHLWLVVESVLLLYSSELLEIWNQIVANRLADLLVLWWIVSELLTVFFDHILQLLDIRWILILRISKCLFFLIHRVSLIIMIVGLYRVAKINRHFLIFIMMHLIYPIQFGNFLLFFHKIKILIVHIICYQICLFIIDLLFLLILLKTLKILLLKIDSFYLWGLS